MFKASTVRISPRTVVCFFFLSYSQINSVYPNFRDNCESDHRINCKQTVWSRGEPTVNNPVALKGPGTHHRQWRLHLPSHRSHWIHRLTASTSALSPDHLPTLRRHWFRSPRATPPSGRWRRLAGSLRTRGRRGYCLGNGVEVGRFIVWRAGPLAGWWEWFLVVSLCWVQLFQEGRRRRRGGLLFHNGCG